MTETTDRDWLALSLVPGLGPAGFRRLLDTFGSPAGVFGASAKELRQIPGLRPEAAAALVAGPPRREAEAEMASLARLGIRMLRFGSEDYPARLAAIYNPPMLLFVKGSTALLHRPALAVVGSRAATSYGLKIAHDLSARLAGQGLVIVSGLALGIDAAAHRGVLEAGGGTVAVLGCGLDVRYPKANWRLAEKIESQGALVSEYRLATPPDAFRFPARNRIISGLCRGVLVVEAAQRSGSLITARLALEEGREVFAIPGRVDSAKSAGTHRLLREGAKLVSGIDDILEELGPWPETTPPPGTPAARGEESTAALSPEARLVLGLLEVYPQPIDTIINQARLGAAKVNEVLLQLELHGLIEALPGQRYRALS